MTAPLDRLDGALFDLSARTKIRVSGTDRQRFLNGQLTNDLRKATETRAVAACVLNAKGKMNAHLFVSARAECFFLDSDPELRETLQTRLDRYVIADDVQIEDLSERMSLLHLLSAERPDLPENCTIVSADRFRKPGWDVWVETAHRNAVFQQISAASSFCDETCAEVFRIERGIPRWRRELTEEIIPVEAGLEESCVDYEKGCYIGQEVISRMKISGQRNKTLCGLIALDEGPFDAGMKLFSAASENRVAGWVTSTARSERFGKKIGLGYVKRPFNQIGAELGAFSSNGTSSSERGRVKVSVLPFALEESELVDRFRPR